MSENEEQEFDPNANFDPNALPNPLAEKEITRDQIKRRLARFGILPDELDVLYPKDKDLLKFYYDVYKKLSAFGGADDGKEDDYKLSPEEKLEYKNLELAERRRAMKAVKAKTAQKALPAPPVTPKQDDSAALLAEVTQTEEQKKAAFEEAGAHLPETERVSYEDAQKAIRDLMSKRRARK